MQCVVMSRSVEEQLVLPVLPPQAPGISEQVMQAQFPQSAEQLLQSSEEV